MRKPKQLSLLKAPVKAFGGCARTKRKQRTSRPVVTKDSMHIVLRSSQAKGKWSLLYGDNERKVTQIIKDFAKKYDVRIFSMAIVGNHIHLHVQFAKRRAYFQFIRAITSAIAMKIAQQSRWTPRASDTKPFWDHRPFTRVVIGYKARLVLKDYIEVNQWEAGGLPREAARTAVELERVGWKYWNTV